jgi:stage II sporulation protein M
MVRKKIRKNKKDNFSFKKEYSQSLNYIRSSKNFIYSIVTVFLFFGILGFFVPLPEDILQSILEMLKDLVGQIEGLNYIEVIQFIFWNNFKSSLYGILFGVAFGIFPVFSSMLNGYVLGFVAQQSVASEGILVLLRLVPHGIFELPAVLISLGLGMKLGTFIFYKKKIETLKEFFWNSIRVFIFVIIPLLLVAAIIEGLLISFF